MNDVGSASGTRRRFLAFVGAACACSLATTIVAARGADAAGPLLWAWPVMFAGWLAPGLLLALRGDPTAGLAAVLLRAAGAASVVHIGASIIAGVLGPRPTPAVLPHALASAAALAAAVALVRRPPPTRSAADDSRLLIFFGAVLLGSFALVRSQLFCDLSSDGVEAYEMARSLRFHVLPRTPGGSGILGMGVGMTTQIFPAAWFEGLFPEADAAPRLPLPLFLPLVFAGVIALAEHGAGRRAGPAALAAAVCTTLAFGAVLGLNASFDPYHSDPASPGAIDVQTAVLLLGLLEAFAGGAAGFPRFVLFAVLGHFARPTAFLVVALLFVLIPLSVPRGERRGAALRLGAVLGMCLAATFLYEKVYAPAATGEAAGLDSGSVAGRLRYVAFGDWSRFAYLFLPTGVLGGAALAFVRRQDGLGRGVTIVALALFGLFYFPAVYAAHHFVPAMVLPVAAFQRLWLRADPDRVRRLGLVAVALAAAGFAACLPSRMTGPARPYRAVGERILWEAPEVHEDLHGANDAADVLATLLVPCHGDDDPRTTFMGSPLSLVRYARRSPDSLSEVEFVLRRFDAPAPEGFRRLEADRGFALYARRPEQLDRVRTLGGDVEWQSPFFRLDRRRLFRHSMLNAGLYDLDLRSVLGG
jgi:hypothetical protein